MPATAPRPYHHGDLRRTLLDVGRRLLEEHGPEALSLREAAREAGVSKAAPYRHFETRDALLSALAEEGFDELRAALLAALPPRGTDVRVRLRACASVYQRFAADHPAVLRLMFARSAPVTDEVDAAATRAFTVLATVVADGQQDRRIRPGAPIGIARLVWALMHGIAVLVMEERLPGRGTPAEAERFATDAVDTLLDGLSPRSA